MPQAERTPANARTINETARPRAAGRSVGTVRMGRKYTRGRERAYAGTERRPLAMTSRPRHSHCMRGTLNETEDGVTLEPPVPATGLVVWLHGLGADGYDFLPFARDLGLAERGLRVVLPHAPPRPVTINGGYVMRAWYDVRDADFGRDPDEVGIRESVGRVSAVLRAEIARGVAADRVVVAGFSQGGVIALEAGMRYPERLAGLVGLSTYLALSQALEAEAAAANRGIPVFLGHGDQDPIIPSGLGEDTARTLAAAGYPVDFRRYRMAHSVCEAEAEDVDAWLRRHLG